jgi:hypothetical protein
VFRFIRTSLRTIITLSIFHLCDTKVYSLESILGYESYDIKIVSQNYVVIE